MAAQRTALEATIDRLREDLEQRMAEVETAVDDAPPSRLLVLPLNQADSAQEPSE